jgi:hypothetical protein
VRSCALHHSWCDVLSWRCICSGEGGRPLNVYCRVKTVSSDMRFSVTRGRRLKRIYRSWVRLCGQASTPSHHSTPFSTVVVDGHIQENLWVTLDSLTMLLQMSVGWTVMWFIRCLDLRRCACWDDTLVDMLWSSVSWHMKDLAGPQWSRGQWFYWMNCGAHASFLAWDQLHWERAVWSFIAEAQTILSSSIKLEEALSGNMNNSGFPVDGIHSNQHSMLEIFGGRPECSH